MSFYDSDDVVDELREANVHLLRLRNLLRAVLVALVGEEEAARRVDPDDDPS